MSHLIHFYVFGLINFPAILSFFYFFIYTYMKSGLSANDTIDKNKKNLKIKFGTDNIPIENHWLPNMY